MRNVINFHDFNVQKVPHNQLPSYFCKCKYCGKNAILNSKLINCTSQINTNLGKQFLDILSRFIAIYILYLQYSIYM
jgi:hypothetical protein